MKVTIRGTAIEATAEELRQSNSLADSLTNSIRRAFNGVPTTISTEVGDDEEDEEEE